MALNFKGLFPPGKEILANFDLIDVVSATGVVVFDGVNAIDSTGDNYILADSAIAAGAFGNDKRPPGATAVGTAPFITIVNGGATVIDVDFDLTPFQLPRTIEGDAFVGLSISADKTSSCTDVVVTAKLRKLNGGESEIVSVTGETRNYLSNSENASVIKLTVPKTHFKAGEQLRLTIQVSSTNANQLGLFHIPDNSIFNPTMLVAPGSAGNTRLSVAIPFKLDIL